MNWYNLYKTSQSSGIISFDFDDTLTELHFDKEQGIWVSSGSNEEIVKKMREFHNQGYKIIIVTSRRDKDMDEVRKFVDLHHLPVDNIYNTNGTSKAPLLKEIGVLKHYDDDPQEVSDAREYNMNYLATKDDEVS